MRKPLSSEYADFFNGYIEKVPEGDIFQILKDQIELVHNLLTNNDEEKLLYKYAPDKWSIKEIIGHCTDTEIIFNYRTVSIARGESRSLLSFDENSYVANSNYHNVSKDSIFDLFSNVRKSTLSIYKTFDNSTWDKKGLSSDKPISVRAFPFILAGHIIHHLKVINERYL